jgi:uncharacterized protein (TIGR03067 family)
MMPMNSRHTLAMALALATACLAPEAAPAAPAPFPRRARPDTTADDVKAMRGEWVRVSVTVRGRSLDLGPQTTAAIAGGRMKYAVGGSPTVEWAFAVNGKVRPARLDRKEVGAVDKSRLGIYRIEGGVLTIHSSDGARPTDFSGDGDRVIVEVFRRKPSR